VKCGPRYRVPDTLKDDSIAGKAELAGASPADALLAIPAVETLTADHAAAMEITLIAAPTTEGVGLNRNRPSEFASAFGVAAVVAKLVCHFDSMKLFLRKVTETTGNEGGYPARIF